MDAQGRNDLRQLLQAALARHGVAGEVGFERQGEHERVTLSFAGERTAADLDYVAARWGAATLNERERLCQNLARTLVAQRRAGTTRALGHRTRSSWVLLGVAAVVIGGSGIWLQTASGARPTPAAQSERPERSQREALAAEERERRARARRACAATESRVLRGATLGPSDAEGWVVEVSLVHHAADLPERWGDWTGFVGSAADGEAERLTWRESEPLATAARGINAAVALREQRFPESAPAYSEQTLTLMGDYVLPFFRERERIEFVRLAHALATQQEAELGALYARCEGASTHQLGAWFAGRNPGAASTALMYFMGVYAHPPQFPARVLGEPADGSVAPAFVLSSFADVTRRIDRRALATMIGGQDGMVAEADGLTSIRFPFVGSNAATRASVAVGRSLGLIEGR